ncbi:hypothetical protein ENBRE01_3497 [Enteropsectra breve]|nr:hypothetical protein ENBRE01_3497 [Enteropsectra breve]
MSVRRKYYSAQFKLDVLSKLRINDNNLTKTAIEHGISPKMLRDWKKRAYTYSV